MQNEPMQSGRIDELLMRCRCYNRSCCLLRLATYLQSPLTRKTRTTDDRLKNLAAHVGIAVGFYRLVQKLYA